MKRYLPLFALAALALIAALVILQVVQRQLREEPSGVPPIAPIELMCVEPPTAEDFAVYWTQFQAAIKTHDKPNLFSMLRSCSFDWGVLKENEGLRKPLASPVRGVSTSIALLTNACSYESQWTQFRVTRRGRFSR